MEGSGLPAVQILLAIIALVLHLIALPSSYWISFYAKNDIGFNVENGHFGFWTVCVHRSFYNPYQGYERELCDWLETMYYPPPFFGLAGYLGIVAAIVLVLIIPLAFVRMRQMNERSRDGQPMFVSPTTGTLKISLAISALLLTCLVLIFVSVRENEMATRELMPTRDFRGFWLIKNWAFYLEVVVALITVLLIMLCVMENGRVASRNKADRYNTEHAIGGSNGNLAAGHRDSVSAYQPCSGYYSATIGCCDPSTRGKCSSSPISNKPPPTPPGSFRRADSRRSLQQLQPERLVACTSTQCQLTQSFERIPRVRSPASVRFSSSSHA